VVGGGTPPGPTDITVGWQDAGAVRSSLGRLVSRAHSVVRTSALSSSGEVALPLLNAGGEQPQHLIRISVTVDSHTLVAQTRTGDGDSQKELKPNGGCGGNWGKAEPAESCAESQTDAADDGDDANSIVMNGIALMSRRGRSDCSPGGRALIVEMASQFVSVRLVRRRRGKGKEMTGTEMEIGLKIG
jgi:hypothetical protein